MSLLFYCRSTKGAGERLQGVIEASVPKGKTETFRSIEGLSDRLCRPKRDLRIAILLAASKEELREFVSIGELLEDIRMILVLADTDRDTVANAHILRPRYLTYVDSDFSDVAAVLSKMLSNTPFDKRRGKNARDHVSDGISRVC